MDDNVPIWFFSIAGFSESLSWTLSFLCVRYCGRFGDRTLALTALMIVFYYVWMSFLTVNGFLLFSKMNVHRACADMVLSWCVLECLEILVVLSVAAIALRKVFA